MFLRDVSFVLGGNLGVRVLSVATGILLARTVGAEGKGLYTVAMTLPIMVAAIGQLGMGQALIYYLRQRVLSREQILGTLILADAVLGTGLFVLAIWGAPELSTNLFRGLDPTLIWVAALFIPVRLVVSQLKALLRGLGRMRAFSVVSTFQGAAALGAVLLMWAGGDLEIARILSAQLAIELCLVGVCALLACRGMALPRPGLGTLRRLLGFGLRSHVVYILVLLEKRFDILLVNAFLDPARVGIYTVAVGLAQLVSLMSNSMGLVLYPRIAGASSKEVREFLPRISRLTLLTSALLAAALLAVGQFVIWILYGGEFADAYAPLVLLLPGVIMLGLSLVCETYLRGTGRPGISSVVAALSFATNLMLNLVLIPRYGIAGAAFASSVSYSLRTAMLMVVVLRMTELRVVDLLVPRASDLRALRARGTELLRRASSAEDTSRK